MTLLTLTPTAQPKTGSSAPLDISALVAAGTLGANTGVSFANSGREVLHFSLTTATSTVIVAIGTTIEGQAVTSITLTPTYVSGHLYQVGPFATDENQPGGTIQVTFGTPANVSGVALIQNAGVF